MNDQELSVIDSSTPIALRDPKEILQEAHDRATALKEMVKNTRSSVRIGAKEHLMFEAWATIANFYGCSVSSFEAVPTEIDGIKGFKAKARVVHDRTATVLSEAEAYCMRDEDNWREKPTFQLASMAQTRAMSKAAASKFRWVVVMAGYAPTPAEEMIHEKRQEDGVGTANISLAEGTLQASDAPAHSPIKAFCDEQAAKASTGELTAEGYIGTYQPRLAGKMSPPGKLTLETLRGEIVLQFWEKPDGLGTPNHSFARVTYRVSQRGKFTNNELLKLEWVAPPA